MDIIMKNSYHSTSNDKKVNKRIRVRIVKVVTL